MTAPDGSPIRIGIGVHTGVAYIGTVSGADAGIEDVRALGDNVNITARLSAMAQPGEALISEATWSAAGRGSDGVTEEKEVELRGRSTPIRVHVMHASGLG